MGSVRISGGTLRGRRIPLPPGELRPTSGRAREAYFNVVAPRIEGARFLDLFAGSGIFSLEALSRGASEAVAVDSSTRAVKALSALAAKLDLPIQPLLADALAGVRRLGNGPEFDLVYADPPYDYPSYDALIAAIGGELPLSQGALVALEHRSGPPPFDPAAPTALVFRKTSRYGNVSITYFDTI